MSGSSDSLYFELIPLCDSDNDAPESIVVDDHLPKNGLNKLPSYLLIYVFRYLESPIKVSGVFTSLSKEIHVGCVTNRMDLLAWMCRENKRVLAANISANEKLMGDNPEVFNPGAIDQAAQSAWIKEHYPKLNLLLFDCHLDRVLMVVFLLAMVAVLCMEPNNAEFQNCMDRIWEDNCSNQTITSLLCTGDGEQSHAIHWKDNVVRRIETVYFQEGGSVTTWDDQEFVPRCMGFASRPLDPLIAVPLGLLLVLGAFGIVCTVLLQGRGGLVDVWLSFRHNRILKVLAESFKRVNLSDERFPVPLNWPLFAALPETTRNGESEQETESKQEQKSETPSGLEIV